jgi:hypothetical protein
MHMYSLARRQTGVFNLNLPYQRTHTRWSGSGLLGSWLGEHPLCTIYHGRLSSSFQSQGIASVSHRSRSSPPTLHGSFNDLPPWIIGFRRVVTARPDAMDLGGSGDGTCTAIFMRPSELARVWPAPRYHRRSDANQGTPATGAPQPETCNAV